MGGFLHHSNAEFPRYRLYAEPVSFALATWGSPMDYGAAASGRQALGSCR